MKWYTRVIRVDKDTGEIINDKKELNKFIKIKSTTNVKINNKMDYGEREITIIYEKSKQGEIPFS